MSRWKQPPSGGDASAGGLAPKPPGFSRGMEHSRMPRGQNGCRQLRRHPHDLRSCCRRIPDRLLPSSACFRFRRRTQPSTARGRRPPCSIAWISLAPAHLPLPSRPRAIRKPSPCSPLPPAAMMTVRTLLYRIPFRLISGLERTWSLTRCVTEEADTAANRLGPARLLNDQGRPSHSQHSTPASFPGARSDAAARPQGPPRC